MDLPDSRIVYLTSGAGGMFCGSCMHDNALARALSEHGWNIQLVPTYTPIRTDEADFSVDQVLFGGLNVFLQQKIPLLRYVPAFLDRFLDSPWLIRKVTSRAVETDAKMLGQLALSMLKGPQGNQRKEITKICRWMQQIRPDLIVFSNILIGGCIPAIKNEIDVPILVTLQGDDVFLDSLNEPYHSKCIDRIKQIATHVDGFIVQSQFFRDYMSQYFSIPIEKFHVTPLGIDVTDFLDFKINQPVSRAAGQVQTIGYMARLSKEKGLHHLVDAFIRLKSQPNTDHIKLKIAGWLGADNQTFADELWQRLDANGLKDEFEYLGSIERKEKLDFFRTIDLLSVPTDFLEPKGLYALEAMAAGVPVVVPAHGAFPELIDQTGGGVLFEPRNCEELARHLLDVLGNDQKRFELGAAGQRFVHAHRNSTSMAVATSEVIQRFL